MATAPGPGGSNPSDDLEKKPLTSNDSKKKRPILDRSLGTAAGLSKLLPTGTTLAFQTMAPSFTRGGSCVDHDVNFAFTLGLIIFLTLLSAALNYTDSVTINDKDGTKDGTKDGNKDGSSSSSSSSSAATITSGTHYGVVTAKGLRIFNQRDIIRESKSKVELVKELKKRRLRREDALHAVVSAAVFLALAFCDAGVQRCLVKQESRPWKDFFNHLPLAVGFLASFLFIVFPTTRKGIGEDGAWSAPEDAKTKTLLGAAASLSKLLPTGTTLAFQTMAPSFTNGADCAGHRVNFAFTWGLIGILALMCAALCFTDSVTDLDHHTYYGIATWNGLRLFNIDPKDLRLSNSNEWEQLRRMKKIRGRDFLHAIVSPAVFVAVAFCDAGVQDCLVPKESTQWRTFLALLPLAVAFLASFLFFIFPSDRKGIGEEGDAFWHLDTPTTESNKDSKLEGQGPHQLKLSPNPGQNLTKNNQISCCVCVRA